MDTGVQGHAQSTQFLSFLLSSIAKKRRVELLREHRTHSAGDVRDRAPARRHEGLRYAVREDDSQEELPDLDMIAEGALGGNDLCGGVACEASMLGRLIVPWLRLRDASPPSARSIFLFLSRTKLPLLNPLGLPHYDITKTLRTQFATFARASMLSPITPPTTFVYTAPSLPYATDAVPAAAAAPAVAAAVHYAAPAIAPAAQYAAPTVATAIHYASAPAVLHAPPRSRRRPRLQSPLAPLLLLHDMTSHGT
ncbi:hypothetical protein B0H14DRAFT_3903053 [Mycena olivaceomarginata]|nr:hypothetical protein B0H14DRAFT_3903053 [Mycena olivaceomarginata]